MYSGNNSLYKMWMTYNILRCCHLLRLFTRTRVAAAREGGEVELEKVG
jgi:hypothetical protein